MIDIFLYGQWPRAPSVLINLINATYTFCWSFNILTENSSFLVLFIATTHANNKYSYHFWIFEVLKYNYQIRGSKILNVKKLATVIFWPSYTKNRGGTSSVSKTAKGTTTPWFLTQAILVCAPHICTRELTHSGSLSMLQCKDGIGSNTHGIGSG